MNEVYLLHSVRLSLWGGGKATSSISRELNKSSRKAAVISRSGLTDLRGQRDEPEGLAKLRLPAQGTEWKRGGEKFPLK